jgi:hypothetical protein
VVILISVKIDFKSKTVKETKKAFYYYYYYYYFNKLKREHQPELNSVMSWTPNLWKDSLCPETLSPGQGEKRHAISHCQPFSKLLV